MKKLGHTFFAFLVAFAVLASATTQPAAALTKSIAVVAMPCCDDDCPENPSCDIACMTMMRCAPGTVAIAPAAMTAVPRSTVQIVVTVPDPPWTLSGQYPEGLKRPPRL